MVDREELVRRAAEAIRAARTQAMEAATGWPVVPAPVVYARAALDAVEPIIRADAIKMWTKSVRSELDAANVAGINLEERYLEGVYSALRQAEEHAARLLNEAEEGRRD